MATVLKILDGINAGLAVLDSKFNSHLLTEKALNDPNLNPCFAICLKTTGIDARKIIMEIHAQRMVYENDRLERTSKRGKIVLAVEKHEMMKRYDAIKDLFKDACSDHLTFNTNKMHTCLEGLFRNHSRNVEAVNRMRMIFADIMTHEAVAMVNAEHAAAVRKTMCLMKIELCRLLGEVQSRSEMITTRVTEVQEHLALSDGPKDVTAIASADVLLEYLYNAIVDMNERIEAIYKYFEVLTGATEKKLK